MPLKTSFFNPTLFKKNLTRSWPLWGGVTAVGSLLPLYLLLALVSEVTVYFERDDFVDFLYSAVVYFLPAFTLCYAILVAMFVWSYLHNSRAVGMMHSLAIDRTGLFVTTTLSGLAMLLIPYVVVGGLMCIIAGCLGAMDVGAVLLTILAVILENLLFFGMGTLCAAVTGSVIATAAYYAILNFAVPVLDALINLLAQEYIFGLTSRSSNAALLFSPVISLYDKVQAVWSYENDVRSELPAIENFWLIVVYGIVGLLMLGISYLLYRKRCSESAGDVVAFSWLRPVFRFGVAVVSALTLGRVLYELFWASMFSEGRYADMVPMAVCMAISAVVGYYAASMLLDKTFRVFKGSLKGIGVVCVATVVLFFAVSLDLFGLERQIPDREDIKEVQINGYLDIRCAADKFPDLTDKIIDMHKAIVADKTYIRSHKGESWNSAGEEIVRWRSFTINYTLKNGSTLERYYYVPMTEARAKDRETYDGKILALASNPDVLIASVTIPEGAEISYLYLEAYNSEYQSFEHQELDKEDWAIVYAALQRDAREGSFVTNTHLVEEFLKGDTVFYDFAGQLFLDYRAASGSGGYYYGNISVELQPTMTHTLNALVAIGALDQETIALWSGGDYSIIVG